MAAISPTSSEAGPSLEEILSQHGLKERDLDRERPQNVRDEIAVKLDDWEMVGRCLEFTLEKLRDINSENISQELCRITLLDTWGKREGKRATYLKLAGVLHRRQRRDLVEFLCAKLKSTLTLVPLVGSVTVADPGGGGGGPRGAGAPPPPPGAGPPPPQSHSSSRTDLLTLLNLNDFLCI